MSSTIFEEVIASEIDSTLPKVEFNASLVITDLLAKTLENCAKELARRCIEECSIRHGFDATVEIGVLGLENLTLIRKQMAKRSVSKTVVKAKQEKAKVDKRFLLPFNSETVDLSLCNGLVYNHGLFTQCPKAQMENSAYCKRCQSECDSSSGGIPLCGTVQQRLASDLYDFQDTKGRRPIRYSKVLSKAQLTRVQAETEAGKLSIVINPEHFATEEPKKSSGTKGRPKKAVGAVVASDVTDLFAKLTATGNEEVGEAAEPVPKGKRASLTDAEKAEKKAALEAEREAKKAALEKEREAKKAEREAKVAAEKAEREAKVAAEKAKREAKVAAEKAEREAKVAAEKAEREAKRQQEKAERDSKKASEKQTKKASKKKEPVPAEVPVPVPAEVPAKITVRRIKIDGKEYLHSGSTNILYDPKTKEEVGLYDEQTDSIKPLPEEDDEEEDEEEYEDDN